MIFKYKDCEKWPYIYVAFCNNNSIFWLKYLKEGFRHCFVIMGDGQSWIVVEATIARTFVIKITDENYVKTLQNQGFKVVRAKIYSKNKFFKSFKFAIFSCVELVKSVLGIVDIKIQTPYKLYKFLKNN